MQGQETCRERERERRGRATRNEARRKTGARVRGEGGGREENREQLATRVVTIIPAVGRLRAYATRIAPVRQIARARGKVCGTALALSRHMRAGGIAKCERENEREREIATPRRVPSGAIKRT
jgi:hypothetical protein